jgi:Tfp pilus assembly protein PilN
MIKVNLFRDKTQKIRKAAAKPAVSRTGLLMVVLLALPLGALGAWWYQIRADIQSLSETRTRLKAEDLRLQGLKKEITRYEALKGQLKSRIEVIERLKDSQSGPVLLLNHVIQSIPRATPLWLTALDQVGDRIQITGFTSRSEAIPDLISNLAAGGFFENVDLELIEDQKDQKDRRELAKFTLVCAAKRKYPTE